MALTGVNIMNCQVFASIWWPAAGGWLENTEYDGGKKRERGKGCQNTALWILLCPGLLNPMRYKSDEWKMSELGDRKTLGQACKPRHLWAHVRVCFCKTKKGERPWHPPLMWQPSARSPVSQIPLCSRRSDTCAHAHMFARAVYLYRQHTRVHALTDVHTLRWRATETAQGRGRSHRSGVPSRSLNSVPPQQYALRGLGWCTADYR